MLASCFRNKSQDDAGIPDEPSGATKYDDLPWYRRSTVLSKFIMKNTWPWFKKMDEQLLALANEQMFEDMASQIDADELTPQRFIF